MKTTRAILVCGGAGYIGSHMCKRLARDGYLPVTFDNLSSGHRWAVKWGPFILGDLLNPSDLARAFETHQFEGVMHFAARSIVGESVQQPGAYFRNNVTGTLNLLDSMNDAGVRRLVFSSTAAVYGDPQYIPIDESHPTEPINPYGWSKLMAEQLITDYCRAHDFRAICLRYFNAAGCDPEGEIGEVHEPETHLIPSILKAALEPHGGLVRIFGDDYDTPDGTCVRDYVHVDDLCDAHLRALNYLARAGGCHKFNLGTGKGHSVLEVLQACRQLCNGKPPAIREPRRAGDPAVLIASNSAASDKLNWRVTHSLSDCVADAIRWKSTPISENS